MSVNAPFLYTTNQAAAGATGNGTVTDVSGYGSIAFQVFGTFVGTVSFEGTINGADWVALPCLNTSGARVTTATATGLFWANVAGLAQIRARVSAWTSGSITVLSHTNKEPLPILATAVLGANSGVDVGDVDVLSIAAGTTLMGDVGLAARASGGGTSLATGAISDTVTNIKASAGQLYHLTLKNTTGAAAYFQIFNLAAASVTLGTTGPTWSIGLAANESLDVALAVPAVFGTAISCAGTTTRTGSTAAIVDMNALYA